MKYILSLIILISSQVHATDITVLALFKIRPTQKVLKLIKEQVHASKIERFDNFSNDYFDRLYRIVMSKKNEINLLQNDSIQSVEKIYKFDGAMSITPGNNTRITSDFFSTYQWGLHNDEQVVRRDIDDINSEVITGKKGLDINIMPIFNRYDEIIKDDVLVAVLDSGVALEHPDLKNNIYKNLKECDENQNLRVKPKDDLDNNGYIGDCMGWDFTSKKHPHRPYDDKGHGTHVAGIIAADKDNDRGVTGLSNKIKILPVKVLKRKEMMGSSGLGTFTDRVAKGILYSIKMGVKVINLSLGWPKAIDTHYLREAVNAAIESGIIIVTAAGNNNTNIPIFPCSYKGVICVGALSIDGSLTRFSNFGGSVDVVAPGEQILSTYPQKMPPLFFSTNGYEIKNGTSQAAPYVTGMMAILRGIFPEASNDELFARMFSTTRPIIQNKNTQNGLIQVATAVKAKKRVVIRPIFKDINGVLYDKSSGIFEVDLEIKNYWKVASNIRIKLELINDGIIDTVKSYNNLTFSSGEIKRLKLQSKIIDFNIDSKLKIKVNILITGEKSKTYFYQTPLVRNINSSDEGIIKTKLVSELDASQIVIENGGKLYPNIRTVLDHYRIDDFPSYYHAAVEDSKLRLTVFSKTGNELAGKTIVLPHARQITSITKMDLNYDGKLDLLIRSIGEIDDTKFIQLTYLDTDLNDLLEGGTHFGIKPEMRVYLNTKKSIFVPCKWKGKYISIPVWVASGTIPEASKNPDPFVDENNSKMKHLYTYVPTDKKMNDDVYISTMMIVDDYNFVNTLNEDYNLFWTDQINILGSYTQNLTEYKLGEASFQISIGEDFLRKYYIVKIKKDLSYKVKEINTGGMAFEGNFKVPVHVINNDKTLYLEHTSFIGFQNNTLAQYAMIDNYTKEIVHKFRYDQEIKTDHLLGVMASYKKDDTLFAFFQSKSNVVLVMDDGKQRNVLFHPINRVSFISGSIFSELYFPVIHGEGKNKLPAYYIDATHLHSGHIYIIRPLGNRLISPIKNNVFIPSNCISMNPVKLEYDLEAYSLLCKENGEIVFNYIPIN